jgi:hypothetical protein
MAEGKKKGKSKGTNNYLMAFLASFFGCIIGVIAVWYLRSYGWNTVILVGVLCGFSSHIFMGKSNFFFGLWCGVLALFFTLAAQLFFYSEPQKKIAESLILLKNQDIKVIGSIIMSPLIAFYFGRGKKDS